MVSAAGGIVIAIVVIALLSVVGWVIFTQFRARKLGLPPPTLTSYVPFLKSDSSGGGGGGIGGWFRSLRNRNSRSATGAYEQPLHGGNAGRRGFGPLDPDEAWDARVGHEADTYGPYGAYEEQELGHTGYVGAKGGQNKAQGQGAGQNQSGAEADRYEMNLPGSTADNDARSPFRDPGNDTSYSGHRGRNPFEEDADPSNMSLRGVSPRPMDGGSGGGARGADDDDASLSERRSAFRENV